MRRNKDRAAESVGAWGELAQGRNAESHPRGSVIYTPDQPAQNLILLSSGQVGLHLLSDEGRALTLRVMQPGQLFGHVALAEAGPYDTFAEALTSVTLYRIQRNALPPMIEREPALGLALLEDLGRHRLEVSHRLDEVAFKSVPARLASLLLHMGDASTSSERLPRRTHQQLAEMINAYRETVTKVINQFRDARLLDVDSSGIRLLNVSQLRKLAQE